MHKDCSSTDAEDRLRSVAPEVLRVLGERIREPICIRSPDGQVLYANSLWHSRHSSKPAGTGDGSDRCFNVQNSLDEVVAVLCMTTDCEPASKSADLPSAGTLLQSVADNTQDAIYVKDRDGKYIFFNQAATRLVGKALEDVLGHDDRAIFDPIGAERIMTHDQEIMTRGEPQSEFESLTAGGITRNYHATKSPYKNAQGEVLGVIGISRDITDQVNANKILQEKTEFLNAVFQTIPECMKILNAAGQVINMNAYGLAMIEAPSLSSVVGHCIFDFIVPEDRQRYVEFHQRVCAGHYEILEFACHNLSGNRMICESHSVPIEINNQRMHLSITRNVTERKQTEKDLFYLWQNAIDPLCIASSAGHFVKVNPAWTKALGWTEEELTSRPWLDFVHPDDRAATIAEGTQLAAGRPVAHFENRYRCKDGSYRWFQWSTIPLAGTDINYGFVRDVTDVKRLSEQFHQAQKMEAIGRLAGGVAHDFNNLLTVINGYSDLLLHEQPAGSSTAEALREIRNAGERAARLTMQLLTFSRKSLVERKAIDLNELITESVSLLRRLIGEDVCLNFTADPQLGKVLADPGQIEQVIMNLVVNARDAMPTGGQLAIRTEAVSLTNPDRVNYGDLEPGEYARLSVSDTGIGMSAEVMDKIFEPFFTTKDSSKGTGLGLAVAHGVVSQCGGHIAVTSQPGQGATFSILLPTEKKRNPLAGTEAQLAKPDGPETILLVEDEEAVRKIASMGLESHGYRVLTAVDVEAALTIAHHHPGPIDLLITDIVMPGLGARELVDKLRATRGDIKVLFISGYTDDAIVRHGIESGHRNFLSKPFTPLTLARKARAMLDN